MSVRTRCLYPERQQGHIRPRFELAGYSHWSVTEDRQATYEVALRQRVKLGSQSALDFTIARKHEFAGDFTQADLALQVYF